MRLHRLLGLLLVASGCAGHTEVAPATVATSPPAPTTVAPAPAAPSVVSCPALEFSPTLLPDRVADEAPPSDRVAIDRFTAIPGTSLGMWVDATGSPVVVLVRGALPPESWQAEPELLEVRGYDAALGRLAGDVVAVAWFEDPVDDCELYSLYLYPPTSEDEVRRVAASLRDLP